MSGNLNNEIDIMKFLQRLWFLRSKIIKLIIPFILLGFIVALSEPVKYESSTIILSSQGQNQSDSNISGLASLAGISLNNSSLGPVISPKIYSKILSSVDFKNELLLTVLSNGETLKENLSSKSPSSFIGTLKDYTINLPFKILDFFRSSVLINEDISDNKEALKVNSDILVLSNEEYYLTKNIDDIIFIEVDDRSNTITLKAKYSSAVNSAIILRNFKEILQRIIINYKIKSAEDIFNFTKKQHQIKKNIVEELEDKIAKFKNENLNISNELTKNKISRLVAKLSIENSVFIELSKQLEQYKNQIAKQTPVFSTIQPVVVPNFRSEPKRLNILLNYLFIGIFFSCTYYLTKEPFKSFIKSIISN